MTKEEKREKARQDRINQLDQAVEALQTQEGWQNFLKVRSTFKSYSLNNLMLIAIQNPDANHVMGFKAWQKLNRVVRKGEKSIRILAPCIYKETNQSTGKEESKVRGFRSVSVFDVSQTEQIEGTENMLDNPIMRDYPLEGDTHAQAIPHLVGLAKSINFSVVTEEITGGAEGYCVPTENKIVLSDKLEINHAVRVLVHELAHALGVHYDIGRCNAEVIADSVAYVVCSGIGLDTSVSTAPYIAYWGVEETQEILKEYGQTILKVSALIEDSLEGFKLPDTPELPKFTAQASEPEVDTSQYTQAMEEACGI